MIIGLLRALRFGLVMLFIVILAMLWMPGTARAAVQQPNSFIEDTTGFPLTLLGLTSASTNWTSGGSGTRKHTIRQGKGLSIFAQIEQTNSVNSTTTNAILKFDVSGDGTNFTTGVPTQPFNWTIVTIGGATGGVTNRFWTNIPPTAASNFRTIQCTYAAMTASNNVRMRIWYSQDSQ